MNPPVASCVSVHPADPEMDEMRCQVMPSNMCSESQPTRLAHVDCGIAALYLIFGDFFFLFFTLTFGKRSAGLHPKVKTLSGGPVLSPICETIKMIHVHKLHEKFSRLPLRARSPEPKFRSPDPRFRSSDPAAQIPQTRSCNPHPADQNLLQTTVWFMRNIDLLFYY